jgi:uncharacterized repeat protein (TIGR03803 family)
MYKLGAFAAVSFLGCLSATSHASTFKVLYHFTDKTDGGNPIGGVVQDASGTIYGETYQGGSTVCPNPPYNKQGCGTVYSLSKSGAFKVLASFTGANGGHGNVTPVLVGKALYGATAAGGTDNDGVVFSVNMDGTNFTLLHQFSATDGIEPDALVAGTGGTLYGITETGGANNVGVLFSLTPSGSYTVLHNFVLPVSGYPNALIIAPNNTLVGSSIGGGSASDACHSGCGTIFTYNPANSQFVTLGAYPGSGLQGYSPMVGSLGPGPTIYAANLETSIFSLDRNSGYTTLADQNFYTVGSQANSGPVYTKGGLLYGLLEGDQFSGQGTIYSLQNGVIDDVYFFNASTDGDQPMARPTLTKLGHLLGTASYGGRCTYCGTVWDFTP